MKVSGNNELISPSRILRRKNKINIIALINILQQSFAAPISRSHFRISNINVSPLYCLNNHFSNCTASRPFGTIPLFVLHFMEHSP
jgi:hypothetical protein